MRPLLLRAVRALPPPSGSRGAFAKPDPIRQTAPALQSKEPARCAPRGERVRGNNSRAYALVTAFGFLLGISGVPLLRAQSDPAWTSQDIGGPILAGTVTTAG